MDIAQDGNLFPREDILEAVAQSDWRDQPVPAAAWWLTAVGLVTLALGMPALQPLAMQPTASAGAGEGLALHPLHALSAWTGGLGIGIESTWYILSALFWGLSLPLLGGALRVMGIGPRLALVTSLLALLTPVTVLHGRLPSDFTAGVFGSILVLAMAFAPSDPGRAGHRGYGVRLALALGVAVLLHPLNFALMLPLLLAARARGGITSMVPVVLASFLGAMVAPSVGWASAGEVLRRWDVAVGLGALLTPAVLAWASSREESPPPLWLTVWFVLGIGGSIYLALVDSGPCAPMLIPASAALVASVLARFARPDNSFRVAAVVALVQALLIMGLPWLQTSTRAGGLAAARPDLFRAGDHLHVTDQQSKTQAAYLVRRRFGIQVEVSEVAPTRDGAGRAIGLSPNPLQLPWSLDPEAGTISVHD